MDSLFATHQEKVPAEELVMIAVYSTEPIFRPAMPRNRNLGNAILLAAIEDYRSLHEERHDSAERFLFPQSPEWQHHYDWVVSLAEGLNTAWLRDVLDRSKSKWDEQRLARMSARMRRGVRRGA
jgi:hypothetical protein